MALLSAWHPSVAGGVTEWLSQALAGSRWTKSWKFDVSPSTMPFFCLFFQTRYVYYISEMILKFWQLETSFCLIQNQVTNLGQHRFLTLWFYESDLLRYIHIFSIIFIVIIQQLKNIRYIMTFKMIYNTPYYNLIIWHKITIKLDIPKHCNIPRQSNKSRLTPI